MMQPDGKRVFPCFQRKWKDMRQRGVGGGAIAKFLGGARHFAIDIDFQPPVGGNADIDGLGSLRMDGRHRDGITLEGTIGHAWTQGV